MPRSEALDVFVSLQQKFINTNEFISNVTLNNSQQTDNIVYIPLYTDTFKQIFHTSLESTDIVNADNILQNLKNFFNPNVYNNHVTLANQLGPIIESFFDDIKINIDKLADDVSADGPLFNYFFNSNATTYENYVYKPFDNDIDYILFKLNYNAATDDFANIDVSNISTEDITTFQNESYISGSSNYSILSLLSSQLRGAILLYDQSYPENDFWDHVIPNDSISVQTNLFIPSIDGNNELHLVLKFHIIQPKYTFTVS